MSKETMKLALEALEDACGNRCNAEYNPCFQREAITAIKEALANEALDKMAENARELGLDYEPEQDLIERERAVGYREGHMAALAQRTWVGLTKPLRDHEIAKILDRERMKWNKSPPTHEFDLAFARAIEAAHGIKGEA